MVEQYTKEEKVQNEQTQIAKEKEVNAKKYQTIQELNCSAGFTFLSNLVGHFSFNICHWYCAGDFAKGWWFQIVCDFSVYFEVKEGYLEKVWNLRWKDIMLNIVWFGMTAT